MNSRTVVVVEPHDDTRELYADYLRRRGFNVNAFSAANEALEAIHSAVGIVTALALRGAVDGIAFIERTREREARHIPIVVVTSLVFAGHRRRAIIAGADVFLPKPCLPDDLVRELEILIAGTEAGSSA